MSFFIGRFSNVDLNDKKVNFYEYTIDKLGEILKDMSCLTGKEAITMFHLINCMSNTEQNQIELSDEDMVFVKKYIGDIK